MATPEQMREIIQIFEETETQKLQSIIRPGFLSDLRDCRDITKIDRGEFRKFLGLDPLAEILAAFPGPLLGPPEDITVIPNRTENFVVQNDFARYRGENFDNWFLGRAEESNIGGILRAQLLTRRSRNPRIIAELGGNLKARITLADIDFAKKKERLRKDGLFYIGYVEDNIRFSSDETSSYINEKGEKCVLRSVNFGWLDIGWVVFSDSVDFTDSWNSCGLILSRITTGA